MTKKPINWIILLVLLCRCHVQTAPQSQLLMRSKVADLALSLTGLPYRSGGQDLDGFDCSGLVHYVFSCFGIELPRSARDQGRLPNRIERGDAQPGDILVFHVDKGWHTGVFVGNNRFVHAPRDGAPVRLDSLNDYWQKRLKAVIVIFKEK